MLTAKSKTPGKNVCKCPSPPGGNAVCDADQLAICRIRNGQIETECLTVPKLVFDEAVLQQNPEPFAEWALENALGPDLADFRAIRKGSAERVRSVDHFLRNNLDTFLKGDWHFENERNGDEVTLSHPQSIRGKNDPSNPFVRMPEFVKG